MCAGRGRGLSAADGSLQGVRVHRVKITLLDRGRGGLRLIARGRSDSEIAAEPVIGLETVRTCVSRILAGLTRGTGCGRAGPVVGED